MPTLEIKVNGDIYIRKTSLKRGTNGGLIVTRSHHKLPALLCHGQRSKTRLLLRVLLLKEFEYVFFYSLFPFYRFIWNIVLLRFYSTVSLLSWKSTNENSSNIFSLSFCFLFLWVFFFSFMPIKSDKMNSIFFLFCFGNDLSFICY